MILIQYQNILRLTHLLCGVPIEVWMSHQTGVEEQGDQERDHTLAVVVIGLVLSV
jgi:hypothetical protein